MKLFAVILAVYILTLSVIVCNDSESHDIANSDIEYALEADHHSDSGETDMCSPFCSCQCCQISIVFFDVEAFDISKDNYYKAVYFYQDTDFQVFTHSLFEPPRV